MNSATRSTNTIADRFEVGKSYTAISPCDSDCVWTFEVIKRTGKFITIREDDRNGTIRRVGVKTAGAAVEYALPFGSYSMSPSIRATRITG